MSFSVRVHPAPFSPTPNRHAGIELEMKGGGPGGSRFELVGLLEPQRKESSVGRTPPSSGQEKGRLQLYGNVFEFSSLHRHESLVEPLIKGRACASTTGMKNRTLMHAAARGGHLGVVKFLLGVFDAKDIAATDSDGFTLIHAAALGGHGDVIAFLSPLHPWCQIVQLAMLLCSSHYQARCHLRIAPLTLTFVLVPQFPF